VSKEVIANLTMFFCILNLLLGLAHLAISVWRDRHE